ncbi:MAG: hypothetical protein ACRDFX_00010 [Chloroflexota bacterium]
MAPGSIPPHSHTAGELNPMGTSPWPWWVPTIVIIGALLTATGAVMVLFPSGEHLNRAGRNYAEYFATRNLAIAALLVVMLALRERRILAALMTLTAFIQLLDAATAAVTGRSTLIPIDLIYATAFLIGAARLTGRRPWRRPAKKPLEPPPPV